jgi:hypothetical protein
MGASDGTTMKGLIDFDARVAYGHAQRAPVVSFLREG